ncbi:MAG: insulinase family protein [Muribaculaceae bacterium]|nr:insulinase family protein [Muribaculaceae bacterium]
MSGSAYNYVTLPSGMRMVHRLIPGAHVDYLGVAVNAGSRDEAPGRHGLAHFVEHTIFKGTGRRRSFHIINRMEGVGGELNAYTTKEETMVYSVFPTGNLDRAAELIADLVTDSQFPKAELDREREVVADEIESYLDTPSETIYDDFDDLIFAGSPLGHNILGTRGDLAAFTSEICRDYLDRFYNPSNMIFFYQGGESAAKVERLAARRFAVLSQRSGYRADRKRPDEVSIFHEVRNIDSHQSHNVTGARIGGMYSPDRHDMALVTNILGGPGMNSRLNVSLRERRGLVYSVEASTALYTDCGLLTIYYGCDPTDRNRCQRLVNDELNRISNDRMTQRQLDSAKKQYLGQLAVASDNREQMALSAARSMLYHDRVPEAAEIKAAIDAITPESLRATAEKIAPAVTSTLCFT